MDKINRIKIHLICVLILLNLMSCKNQNIDQQKNEIKNLSSIFSDYRFDTSFEIYLKAYSLKTEIDTTVVEQIYDIAILNQNNSWIYLNVYDIKEIFIFQIYRDKSHNGAFKFSKTEYY